ncbi:hypothetical protein EXIGLDRAFT_194514 [Exidia glandulosa HHB12029]|uniref:C2H2-type domain-containing protein n=1 Tax=Exidia glandulosa HHB12029 TaxID=1314781 RepID=A0A165EVV9_EXIGL|nr:hypothetical protein EXIGLDRAFT_194514 [Exidia glandulosa HHB12029]
MQISLPPFHEAFPEALIYATPMSSPQPCNHGSCSYFPPTTNTQRVPNAQTGSQSNDSAPSRHATASPPWPSLSRNVHYAKALGPPLSHAQSHTPQAPNPTRSPTFSQSSQPSSRSPTPPSLHSPAVQSQIRPALRCTEAHCSRVYSCMGNLNRHLRVAHGIKGHRHATSF